jgi:hypothetical protein
VIATSTAIRSVEVLSFQPQSPRATQLLRTMGLEVRERRHATVSFTRAYTGGSDLLCLWGPGAPDRVAPMRRQLESGGHVLCFDLAYWDRHRKVRVSIDGPHPQAWVMRRDWPASRMTADRIVASDAWNPDGPVVIAGIGDKAKVQYGSQVHDWELRMIADARRRGYEVTYRPKKLGLTPTGVARASAGPIESVLPGSALVCTWHSNVAIDAIRLGIPVICQDGAAAAVCPSTWSEDPVPLVPAVRDRFLANLAWFQWGLWEADGCWRWVTELLA